MTDTHLNDGSTVVVSFMTKNAITLGSKPTPVVTLNIDRPDGTKIKKEIKIKPNDFSASKDSCNVRFGKNYFRGNLKYYEIHVEDKDISLDIQLKRTSESWRPQTGYFYFDKESKDYFAWLVAVPKGEANVKYTYNGKGFVLSGSAYHDHNWGNISILKVFNHWYWARAEIGPYTIVASEIISSKKYDNQSVVVLNISKDGKTVSDNGLSTKMFRSYGKFNSNLKKDISDDIYFINDFPEKNERYEISFSREKNIYELDIMSFVLKSKLFAYPIKKITGLEPGYVRMLGEAQTNKFIDLGILIIAIKSLN